MKTLLCIELGVQKQNAIYELYRDKRPYKMTTATHKVH